MPEPRQSDSPFPSHSVSAGLPMDAAEKAATDAALRRVEARRPEPPKNRPGWMSKQWLMETVTYLAVYWVLVAFAPRWTWMMWFAANVGFALGHVVGFKRGLRRGREIWKDRAKGGRAARANDTYAAPQGPINEAISTLDHIGRCDLGSAVKALWQQNRAGGQSVVDARRDPFNEGRI